MHSGWRRLLSALLGRNDRAALPGQKLQTSTAGPIARRRPNGMRARVT